MKTGQKKKKQSGEQLEKKKLPVYETQSHSALTDRLPIRPEQPNKILFEEIGKTDIFFFLFLISGQFQKIHRG